ncbi:LacI family DNA-binding transcriptional regulator [Aegicerativicinus sediminis]|uniref:LacI family DNA-binding transcriptional regulator n=1 Tax=Aegicerativicinus sediminis TaxID=2893202 RepID=UPI001E5422F1|nr:LacI family DNA-binding transcriptional regulator [Aegicerativicinus sediminis]
MSKKKDVTIYDIAEKLNLSSSTISRALKNHHSIGAKTIKKVQKTAKEMGYTPNIFAASLRSNQTKTIGVLMSRINRPFISTLISGIEDHAQKKGYNILIAQSNDSFKNEVEMANALYNSRVSGVICSLAMETVNTDHFKQFQDKNIPVVFVDRTPASINTYKVMIDNYSAGYNATKHLILQGCERIAHFAGSQHRMIYSERRRGYIAALQDHGITIDEKLIIYFNSLSHEEGVKATKKLLKSSNPPDGIFTANDTTGVSVIQTAKKMGVKVPEELAVIGFNNDPISSIIDPGLSTITHPAFQMGQTCADQIIHHLEENSDDQLTSVTFLKTEVLVRESSKRK